MKEPNWKLLCVSTFVIMCIFIGLTIMCWISSNESNNLTIDCSHELELCNQEFLNQTILLIEYVKLTRDYRILAEDCTESFLSCAIELSELRINNSIVNRTNLNYSIGGFDLVR